MADRLGRVVKCVCPLDCPDTCAMEVVVEDGRAVSLRGERDHPFTRGALCGKMADYLNHVYRDDRVLRPLRRVGPKRRSRGC
jgi:anaerobic selenocysteine-containing dehydrogenase